MTNAAIFTWNHTALVRLVAGLFAAVGLTTSGGSVGPVRRCVYWTVSRVLCSAEPAARRLIVVLALSLSAPKRVLRAVLGSAIPRGEGDRVPAFSLFDARRRFEFGMRRLPAPAFGPAIRSFDDPSTWPVEVAEAALVLGPDGPD